MPPPTAVTPGRLIEGPDAKKPIPKSLPKSIRDEVLQRRRELKDTEGKKDTPKGVEPVKKADKHTPPARREVTRTLKESTPIVEPTKPPRKDSKPKAAPNKPPSKGAQEHQLTSAKATTGPNEREGPQKHLP